MKNDYTPSESGGLAWLADKGAREAQYDGQGSLVALPEKGTRADKYDRLLEALYHAAYCARENTREGCFVTLGDFIEALENFLEPESDAAGHQIDEGIRDAAKSTAKREEAPALTIDNRSVVNGVTSRMVERTAQRIADDLRRAVAPPTDHTTEPFTEEEIAAVRNDKESVVAPYSRLAMMYKNGEATTGRKTNIVGQSWSRLAAIAQHLADMGE